MAEHDPRRPVAARPAYEQDYAAWVNAQAELLRERRLGELDVDHLLDEVNDLGLSEFRAFRSAIEIVIAHMLKWDMQPAKRSVSWVASIEEHRDRIEESLSTSPSYRGRIAEAVEKAYRPARSIASRETEIPSHQFPGTCPYSWAEITGREHPLDR